MFSACTMRLENHHNSVVLIVTACDGLYRHVGFVARSMVAKYALLCTLVWEMVVSIGCSVCMPSNQ